MNIIPVPRSIKYLEESFKLKRETNIILDYNCSFEDLDSAILLQKEINKDFGLKINITKASNYNINNMFILLKKIPSMEEEEYKLIIKEDRIEINASSDKGLFYGIQTLIQIIREYGYSLPAVIIEDKPYFKHRGFYHDITRGKVPKLETLMKLVDKAAFYKINELQLYIEHTFAFKGMSEVWMDKDPLTSEEILLLDNYCRKKHVELIPSIATFGHLYEVLKTQSFKRLCELDLPEKEETKFSFIDRMAHHTLNVSDEGSIKLVRGMLEEFIPLFSSNKFNICCDETFDLGKGKSSKEAEELGVGKLYVDFLNKVISIVKKYHKEVMFWGDVILGHPDLIDTIDKDAICLNWNYWYGAEEKDTKAIYESGRKQYVCPGVAGWNHLMNLMDNAFENIYRMVSYGVKYNAIGVLNTNWGDFGNINLLPSSIPAMIYGAALSWNPEIEKDFNKMYKDISVIEFEDSSGTLVKLLADLGKCQHFNWEDLVVWKEKFNTDEPIKEQLINKMKKANLSEIHDLKEKVYKIIERFQYLSYGIKDIEAKEIIQEFIIASRGISLINEIMVVIINCELYKDNSNLENTKYKELAKAFEEWFYDYSSIWRKTNKESELYRIKDVIKYTCSYLRYI
ncbi:MAG: family 20 glycosylhydrolase [Clostridium sp.]|uniref:glycoside hydrolase family 20 zincin-like fold domain-containing protein n=1 Tax=Clostridium sp. TaxID=1506 RepID=UPI0025BFB423|nr:glycoside hydrolase family 20 zincin-like fold domain-containing protein [Clostridium sp.]MCF0146876.1 family 20 glycosylhydrolase [Clostridium sp.]